MEHGFLLLGGDTVAPSGLYARLCHAFLVLFETFVMHEITGENTVRACKQVTKGWWLSKLS